MGCGAVGSSIAYLLPLAGVRASVHLIDGDLVDVTNLNRSPIFFAPDRGQLKCDVVAAWIRRSGIYAEPVPKWFDDAVSAGLIFRGRPDLVIPAANDRGVRHAIQHQVPPLQIYGTTGHGWQAFLGRHIPIEEDCLACRFPATAPAAPPLLCSTGSIAAPAADDPSRDAALPFLSVAAAVLAVAEMLKAARPSFPFNANFACLDFKGPLTDFLTVQQRATPTCFCTSDRRIWERLNAATRFARSK